MKQDNFVRAVSCITLLLTLSVSAYAQAETQPKMIVRPADYDQRVQAAVEESRRVANESGRWEGKGDALLQNGKYEEAAGMYRKAIEIHTGGFTMHKLAEALTRDGQVDEAIKTYRSIYVDGSGKLSASGGDLDDHSLMQFALLLCQNRQYPEAIAAYERGVQILNQHADRDAPPINQHFDVTLNFNPRRLRAAAHTGLAMELRRGLFEDKNERLRHAQIAVELQPDMAVAQFYLGAALLKFGKWKEARIPFGEAVAHGHGDVKKWAAEHVQ